jgi:ABC-2 type transport system ATP-binding protein
MDTLEARGLTKYYTAVPAVSDVTFSVRPGEVLGCLGPNGSGKSSTVRMLIGLSEPTRGQVLFSGKQIQGDLVGYRRRLGYVPEEGDLYPYLSAYEYLEIVGTLRRIPKIRLKKKMDAMLTLFSLHSHRNVAMSSYSKGMRQRVLLIAALLHDPQLLIFDEPLSGLDVTSALIVKNLIRGLGERGKSVFYCSHVLEVVEKVCSHVMILRKGRILAYAPTEDIQKSVGQKNLEQAFVHLVEDRDAETTARELIQVMAGA